MGSEVTYTERMDVLKVFTTQGVSTRQWTDREFAVLSDLRRRIMVEWTPVHGYRITKRGIAALRPARAA